MKEQLITLYGYVLNYGLDILSAILIFLIGKWLCKIVANLSEKVMLKSKVDVTLTAFLKNIIYYALLAVMVIAVLNKLGIQTTSIVAIMGACGLAVGLALQGSLSNLAAGVIIILFRPFSIGDTIETAGVTGKVKEIQIFNTLLQDADKLYIIPNSKISADKITVSIPQK